MEIRRKEAHFIVIGTISAVLFHPILWWTEKEVPVARAHLGDFTSKYT
jgi:hypothetical protein